MLSLLLFLLSLSSSSSSSSGTHPLDLKNVLVFFFFFFFFFWGGGEALPPPWIRRPFSFLFLLVREVGDVRWVPLLRVWKIDPKLVRKENKSVGVPPTLLIDLFQANVNSLPLEKKFLRIYATDYHHLHFLFCPYFTELKGI